jgi:hypothetical protein
MFACSQCKTEKYIKPDRRGTERLPAGWKRLPNEILCGKCVKDSYVIRAVEFPVASPVDMTREELNALLDGCWREARRLANWAECQLFDADKKTLDAQGKAPAMPKVYLYGIFKSGRTFPRRRQWDGATQSAAIILRGVERAYRKWRNDVVFRGKRSLSSHDSVPFPVDADAWSLDYGDNRQPLVSVALPGGRITLRLRYGAEFGRQLAGFAQIFKSEAVKGELALRKNRRTGDVMVKLVARFPRRQVGERLHTMLVRTDPNALWVVEQEGHAPWILNADHIRRWVECHRVFLQRIGEDMKHEKRIPRQQRGHMDDAIEDRCIKQNDRLATFCHQVTVQLSALADRRRVATVIYDDKCREWISRFPWHQLRTKLAYKLDGLSVQFHCSEGVSYE